MRIAHIFLSTATLAAALACASCGSNPLQSALASANAQIANANTQVANTNMQVVAANAQATAATAAAKNTAAAYGLTDAQFAAFNQLVTANNLNTQQQTNLQALLRQGTLNDQQAGLSPQQQAQNTTKRIIILRALFGQNALGVMAAPQ